MIVINLKNTHISSCKESKLILVLVFVLVSGRILVHICRLLFISTFVITYWLKTFGSRNLSFFWFQVFKGKLSCTPAISSCDCCLYMLHRSWASWSFDLEGNWPGLVVFKTRDVKSTSAAPCWQLVDLLSIPAHRWKRCTCEHVSTPTQSQASTPASSQVLTALQQNAPYVPGSLAASPPMRHWSEQPKTQPEQIQNPSWCQDACICLV